MPLNGRRRPTRRSRARSRSRHDGPAPDRRRGAAGGSRNPRRTSERPDTRRAAHLVGADRHEVDAQHRRTRQARDRPPGPRRRAAALRARGTAVPPRRLAAACRPRGCPTAGGPSAVSGRIAAAIASTSTWPRWSHPTGVTSAACAPASSRTRCVSTSGTTMCAPRSAAPHVAAAIASVAPLVNTTSRFRAPRSSATASRASSTAIRAAWPSV